MYKKNKKFLVGFSLISTVLILQFYVFAQNVPPALEIRTPIEDTIKAGETKTFKINLDAGKYVRIISRQDGIMSFVRVYKPAGDLYLEERNFLEPFKDNRVLIATETAGEYKIEIISIGQQNQSGKFKLILEEIRDLTPPDQYLLKAQQTLLEAEKLFAQRNGNQALEKYEESLQYWQNSGDAPGQADVYSYWGIALFSKGMLPEALEKVSLAREFYNKAGDINSEAVAYRGIGLVYHQLGELDKALEAYQKGLKINRNLNNEFGEANDLGNIGGIYQYRGEYQKALEYYRNALTLAKKHSNKRNEARLLNNIGEVYRVLDEYLKAIEYLSEALQLRRLINDKRGEGATLNNLALAYTALEDYPNAINHYDLSLKIRREIGDIRGEATSLHNIGHIQYRLGDYQKALDYLNQALPLRQKVKDKRGEASTFYILGQVNQALSKNDVAFEHFQKALELSRLVIYRQTETAALKSLAKIEFERGNLEKADELLQEALEIIESMRTSFTAESIRTSFFSSVQDYYKAYIDILMAKHKAKPDMGFDLQALKLSEKSRARSLLELLAESGIELTKGVDQNLIAKREKLQKQINLKERQRAELDGQEESDENKLEIIEKELNELLERYDEIRSQIRTENPDYAELTEPPTLELKDIQNLLDKDSVLLEYSLGEKQSFVWMITKDSAESFVLPEKERINETSKELYDLLTKRNQPAGNLSAEEFEAEISKADKKFKEASTTLSKMILNPFAGKLPGKRLIIVGDEFLRYIPFGTLTKSNENYQPLILDYEIVNLPSASTLAVLRKRTDNLQTVKNSVAVFADPVFSESDARVAQSIARLKAKPQTQNVRLSISPDGSLLGELKRSAGDLNINEFRRLRFSRREAEDITSFVPADKKFKAIDFAADRQILTNDDLAKYQILHFATHGLLNNKNPELSGIVLSLVDENGKTKDGFLRLHEIYNMKIGADLVVLSACQTALGKDVRGEGLIGLTRGFMYAGAESVVASLWQVEDRATADLMKKFYRAMLKDGQNPSAALRTAQVEMLKEKRWNSPYYWAAFTLQGEWQ